MELIQRPRPVTESSKLRCRYFVQAKESAAPIEWFPPSWGETWGVDCRYFGLALAAMDRLLPASCTTPPLHVYVTWSCRSLPEYGAHVVVLLLGEEIGLVPRYVRHVRAVFKTMRLRPTLGSRTWWKVDQLTFLLWLKFARNWTIHLRSRWQARFVPRHWPPRVKQRVEVFDVPLGYFLQELVPQKTMAERWYHCFFAGQVVSGPLTLWRRFLPTPKACARRKMLAMIQRLRQSEQRFRFDGGEVTDVQLGQHDYSQRLMNSKICLAPRGSVPDSFRFFEGLRAGCLVVCEPLTQEWFYAGAPVIQIDDWNEFPHVIRPFLEDDAALEQARLRSLQWWEQKCGEAAVGRAMADYVAKANIRP